MTGFHMTIPLTCWAGCTTAKGLEHSKQDGERCRWSGGGGQKWVKSVTRLKNQCHAQGARASKSKQEECEGNEWDCKSYHSHGEFFLLFFFILSLHYLPHKHITRHDEYDLCRITDVKLRLWVCVWFVSLVVSQFSFYTHIFQCIVSMSATDQN